MTMTMMLWLLLSKGGSRNLFWEGHIGLESPKTTKADAEDVEEDVLEGIVYPLPNRLGGLGSVV